MLSENPQYLQGQIDALFEVLAAIAKEADVAPDELLLAALPRLKRLRDQQLALALPDEALRARERAIEMTVEWLEDLSTE
jgi:hypothetical protein